MTGAEKARSLADFIEMAWLDLGEPCSARTIEKACSFADVRCRAFDAETAVLAHGDAHASQQARRGSDGGAGSSAG
jgi:streptomycin 6-kinase